jgi:hypothetical protein
MNKWNAFGRHVFQRHRNFHAANDLETRAVLCISGNSFIMCGYGKWADVGAKAVGLSNRGEDRALMTLHLRDIGLSDAAKCRDLRAHNDVACTSGTYTALVPRHGVVMLRIIGR